MPTCAPGAHEGFKEHFNDSTMVSDIGVRGHSPIVVQGQWLEELGANVWRNAKL